MIRAHLKGKCGYHTEGKVITHKLKKIFISHLINKGVADIKIKNTKS